MCISLGYRVLLEIKVILNSVNKIMPICYMQHALVLPLSIISEVTFLPPQCQGFLKLELLVSSFNHSAVTTFKALRCMYVFNNLTLDSWPNRYCITSILPNCNQYERSVLSCCSHICITRNILHPESACASLTVLRFLTPRSQAKVRNDWSCPHPPYASWRSCGLVRG
jgi:hypothetical protein